MASLDRGAFARSDTSSRRRTPSLALGKKGRRGAGEREREGYRSIRARTSVLTAGTAPLRISLLVLVVNLAPFLAKKSALNGPKVTHLLQQRVPACSSRARAPLSRVRRTVRAGHTLCKCIVSSLSSSRHDALALCVCARWRGVCIDVTEGGRNFPSFLTR